MKTGDVTGGESGDRCPVSLDDLDREYRTVGIGPVILEEVRDVIRGVVRGYDPVVYGQVASWELGLDDIVQEFGLDVLVGQGQLDYAMTVASDRLHFRRLMGRQVRYLLARRRRRTIIDNLLDRAKKRVTGTPFRLLAGRSEWSYTLEHKDVAPGRVSQDEARYLAYGMTGLPVVRSRLCQRAPTVYSEDTLDEILETVAGSVACAVRVSDLDRILGMMLTSWVPRFLKNSAGALARAEAAGLDSEQLAIVNQQVRRIFRSCPESHREVLGLKLEGLSDRQVAEELTLSRPTASKRKREAMREVERGLAGMDEELRLAVMNALAVELARNSARSSHRVMNEDGEGIRGTT